MKYIITIGIMILSSVNLLAVKKCYCEEDLQGGGHLGYTYNVVSGGCCTGTADIGQGYISTWALDNNGKEWLIDDDFESHSVIQGRCCEES